MMNEETPPEKLPFKSQLIEWVAMFTILCVLAGLILPAQNAIRAKQSQPPLFEFLPLNLEDYLAPFIFFCGPPLFTLALYLIRQFMPHWVQDMFPWRMPREEILARNARYKLPPPVHNPHPPVFSFLLAQAGTLLLLASACHFRENRSQSRRPIITFVGPFGDYAPMVGQIGIGLSVAAMIAGIYVMLRYTSHRTWLAVASFILGMLNLMVAVFFLALIYED